MLLKTSKWIYNKVVNSVFLLIGLFLFSLFSGIYVSCFLLNVIITASLIHYMIFSDELNHHTVFLAETKLREVVRLEYLVVTLFTGSVCHWLFFTTDRIEALALSITLFYVVVFVIHMQLNRSRIMPYLRSHRARQRSSVDPDINY